MDKKTERLKTRTEQINTRTGESRPDNEKQKIRNAAMNYLAPRDRTCAEMNRYLQGKDFSQAGIEAVIKELEQRRYLDDAAYCQKYFRYAFRKGRGSLRARRELAEKGVDRATIEIAWEDYQAGEEAESELERAEREAAKMAGGRSRDDKLPGRIGRKLTYLGYSADIVYQVVGKYMRNRDE